MTLSPLLTTVMVPEHMSAVCVRCVHVLCVMCLGSSSRLSPWHLLSIFYCFRKPHLAILNRSRSEY